MIITIKINTVIRWASLIFLLAYTTAGFAGGGHEHGDAGHEAHDDHADEPALVYTHYTEATELFVEFPPLIVNEGSTFVAHFTRMDSFKPLTSGTLNVYLKQNGKTAARFRVKAPSGKGVFRPKVTAKNTGDYNLLLEIRDADLHSVHDLGVVTVFANEDAVKISQEEAEGEINYSKEQQWTNPFAIELAKPRGLRPSVPGFATVVAPVDGYAVVRAPSDGYFTARHFFNAGEAVTADQVLGALIPRLGEGADIGNLLVSQEKARAQHQLAEADFARLQGLYAQGAIPEKRLQEARQALEVARVELQTARSRMQQRAGQKGTAGISLTAPIEGELVEVSVRPGAFVRAGEALFAIADRDWRWLEVQVPEKFGLRIHQATGAWLMQGDKPLVLDANSGAQVVKVSRQVDPKTRSVNAAIQYPADIGPTLLGSRFAAHVYVDEAEELLAIPLGAIIDDAGQAVVYVQTGGETFARRSVTLGVQDGPWVQVTDGIKAGEWVVSRGAYFVKLASSGGDAIGHGHAH